MPTLEVIMKSAHPFDTLRLNGAVLNNIRLESGFSSLGPPSHLRV